MSRSGYSDDYDEWRFIMWRGAVASAIRGKRGQAFLYEALAALDALPAKRLIAENLIEGDETLIENANVCLLGAVGLHRRIDMRGIDPEDYETVAGTFGLTDALAREVMWINDEGVHIETSEQRFTRVRKWVVSQIGQWRQMVEGDL